LRVEGKHTDFEQKATKITKREIRRPEKNSVNKMTKSEKRMFLTLLDLSGLMLGVLLFGTRYLALFLAVFIALAFLPSRRIR
jgi:hypothetical protein